MHDVIAPPIVDVEKAREQLRLIQDEMARRAYRYDPVLWVEEKLGDVLWSKQKEILEAIVRHRKVAVHSCHEIGKSFISAIVVGWWIDTTPPGDAFVVTSAPSGPQVRTILWKEIGRVHTRGNLQGRVNQTEWIVRRDSGKEEQVAIGRKPNDYDPTAFQGIHAPRCMYVFDEACGMPAGLWEAGDSLIANDESRALAFGNPDDPESYFAEICKPGSGWHVIQVGAFDTPNFTGEEIPDRIKRQLIGRLYVEEKRRKWAPNWIWVDREGKPADPETGVRVVPLPGEEGKETGVIWQSKVLGLFPENADEMGLLPRQWIRAAQERDIQPTGAGVLGLDVGAGGDSSCCAYNRNGHIRILWEDRNPDTMQTCGKLLSYLQKVGASLVNVDLIGIGRGIVDRAKELRKPVVGIDVGKAAYEQKIKSAGKKREEEEDEGYANLRAQLWWNVRQMFERGEIDLDPRDEDLAGELVSIRYKRTSTGKIQIESKLDAKKRGVPSPNRADALMLSTAKEKPKLKRATWGSRRNKRGQAA